MDLGDAALGELIVNANAQEDEPLHMYFEALESQNQKHWTQLVTEGGHFLSHSQA